jgi:hypothetical protein
MKVQLRKIIPNHALLLLLALVFLAPLGGAQESVPDGGAGAPAGGQPPAGAPQPGTAADQPAPQPGLVQPAPGRDSVQPPRGFRSIRLGMELEQVKELLIEDPLFDYRGDPDISFLPLPPQTLIETSGSSFIRRAYFQFDQDLLYIIILSMDPDRLDYYTLYSTLTGKYGQPTSLDPTGAVWQFEGLRLSLERPLNVKYIDSTVFETLKEEGQVQEDLWEISKENFLQQF